MSPKLQLLLALLGMFITTGGALWYMRALWRDPQQKLRYASQMAWLLANLIFAATGGEMVTVFCLHAATLNALILAVGLVRGRWTWSGTQDGLCMAMVAVCLTGYFVYNDPLTAALLAVAANQAGTVPTYNNAFHRGERTIGNFAALMIANGMAVVAQMANNGGFEFVSTAGVLTAVAGNTVLVMLVLTRRTSPQPARRPKRHFSLPSGYLLEGASA